MTTDHPSLDYRSYNEFNVKAFTGIDFYLYKGLFVGAELGIKFATRTYGGYYTKGNFNEDYEWEASLETDKKDKVSGINLST